MKILNDTAKLRFNSRYENDEEVDQEMCSGSLEIYSIDDGVYVIIDTMNDIYHQTTTKAENEDVQGMIRILNKVHN